MASFQLGVLYDCLWNPTNGKENPQLSLNRILAFSYYLKDFAELASDELTGGYDIIKGEKVKIKGYLEDFALTKKEADDLIMCARNIVY